MIYFKLTLEKLVLCTFLRPKNWNSDETAENIPKRLKKLGLDLWKSTGPTV